MSIASTFLRVPPGAEILAEGPGWTVAVATATPGSVAVSLGADAETSAALLTPAAATMLGATAWSSPAALRAAVAAHGGEMVGEDVLWSPQRGQADAPAGTRVGLLLPNAARPAFASFAASLPEEDADEAFVELDHDLVTGAWDEGSGRLLAAASAYEFHGTGLWDIGVVTLPAERGRGLGRACVAQLVSALENAGHAALYRCQASNSGSMALAASLEYERIGTWDAAVSLPEAPRHP